MLVPLIDQSFETEVAEHGHVTSIEDRFQEIHDDVSSLAEGLTTVAT
jgi:hypothetical protein